MIGQAIQYGVGAIPHTIIGEGMTAEAWIAAAALIITVFATAITATMVIVTKINRNKEQLDEDLTAIRLASYEEYKTLRREIQDVSTISRREFGDTVHAIREKVVQIELWTRDQLAEIRASFSRTVDMRHSMAMDKIEKTDDRVRQLELFAAKASGPAE